MGADLLVDHAPTALAKEEGRKEKKRDDVTKLGYCLKIPRAAQGG
jgi:hypothetical protein